MNKVNLIDDELLFRIVTGEHDIKIYTNGRVEGIEMTYPSAIFNFYPPLVGIAIAKYQEDLALKLPSPAITDNLDPSGLSQSIAPTDSANSTKAGTLKEFGEK